LIKWEGTLSQRLDMIIEIDVLGRLMNIFEELGWNPFDKNHTYRKVFDKYCQLLSLLNKEEQELIILLTQDFLHCHHLTYVSLLKEALENIPSNLVHSANELYLIPLASPKDLGKAKSSGAMIYSYAMYVIKNIPELHAKNPRPYEMPNLLDDLHKDRKNAMILIFDDFIGTGDTAEKALNYYNTFRKQDDIPIVIALVAQERGIEEINNLGFEISVACKRKRGITDSTRIDDIPKAVRIMEQIENRLGIQFPYKFGYRGSESLVSMLRTPDNTFPVFWQGLTPDGKAWPAPFERD
jgi:hypothetical protein